MTLDQLRVFIVVAKHEHMTRASYELGMVQSAVSKSIAALEGEVEFRLFDRVGRNIRLTDSGSAFLGRATDMLDQFKRLSTWASELRSALRHARAPAPVVSTRISPTVLFDRATSDRSSSVNDRIELDRRAFAAGRARAELARR